MLSCKLLSLATNQSRSVVSGASQALWIHQRKPSFLVGSQGIFHQELPTYRVGAGTSPLADISKQLFLYLVDEQMDETKVYIRAVGLMH